MTKAQTDPEAVKAALRTFINSSSLSLTGEARFANDASFLETGLLDSTGVLELVGHIEKEYGIRVDADEIIPDNLDSLDKLTAFIAKKTAV